METPKEKAEKLFARFQNIESERYPLGMDDDDAYECAKIAVELILNDVGAKDWENEEGTNYNYWQEVLNELNKL